DPAGYLLYFLIARGNVRRGSGAKSAPTHNSGFFRLNFPAITGVDQNAVLAGSACRRLRLSAV
ncbi:MAG TPA: hypothetical protein VK797_01960, partial [Tepidisphaeraceae bacterium]|nr:hypothetical protein [Tepidisphaeraceae bacterium]